MKRNFIIISFIILLLTLKITGQSNFQDGYILTTKLDTLFGIIDNKNYYNNSQFCDFKDLRTDSIQRFYPRNIYGYRFINGKYYISKSIDVKSNKLCIFMEYLIKGNLDIYFYQDKNGENHYYISKDTLPLREIIYYEGMGKIDGKNMYYESKLHIGLLNFYTQDCPDIKDEILKMNEPNHQNLVQFAKKYHNLTCPDVECIIYEKKEPRKLKFNVYGGINYFHSHKMDIDEKLLPSYGFNILIQQSQNSENLYVGIGWTNGLYIEEIAGSYRVPISVNYLNARTGISPFFTYEMDLNTYIETQALRFGLKYQMDNISFLLNSDIKTVLFIFPYGTSLNFGIMFDLKNKTVANKQ